MLPSREPPSDGLAGVDSPPTALPAPQQPDATSWGDGTWRVAAAWATGTAHAVAGAPRQDGHAFRALPGLGLVIALSDGAGSAALSQHGAAAATAATIAEARDRAAAAPRDEDVAAWRAWLRAVAGGARAAVEREAAARGAPLAALACTLVVLVATPERVAVAQVGDGAVVAAFGADDGTQSVRRLTLPENGEHVNVTSFLTGSGWERDLQVGVHGGAVEALAAFTDGLQLLLLTYPERDPNELFFRALFGTCRTAPDAGDAAAACGALLGHDRVRRLTDDDLTIVVAAPAAPRVAAATAAPIAARGPDAAEPDATSTSHAPAGSRPGAA